MFSWLTILPVLESVLKHSSELLQSALTVAAKKAQAKKLVKLLEHPTIIQRLKFCIAVLNYLKPFLLFFETDKPVGAWGLFKFRQLTDTLDPEKRWTLDSLRVLPSRDPFSLILRNWTS